MSNDSANPESNAETIADEQLVAYLDGELDDDTSRRIEALLASDPTLRQHLGDLERSWDALEQLERSDVDDGFTHTTLEMVAVAVEEDIEQLGQEVPLRTRRRWVVGGACLAAAAMVGFVAVVLALPDPNRQLIEDLPVLDHLEQYRQVDDIDFLRELDRQGLFPEVADEE